jgi:3-oxoacyl-[acyl-carrier protein] reductase
MQGVSLTNLAVPDEFDGVAVAVIGGCMGSGPAVVRAFAARGAKVAIGVTTSEAVPSPGTRNDDLPGVGKYSIDTSDENAIRVFFDRCEAELGGLDVVVMVAAPVTTASALEVSAARYRDVIEQELVGPVLCLQEAARRMQARGRGRLISFSSMSGKTGVHRHVAPYAASKGGLIAFSRTLAAELAPSGVTVNVIATSLFDVQLAGASQEKRDDMVKGIPVGRVGNSEEAAHAVLYLASRLGAYVTGETLNLSGGRFMD